ncbi:MAG: cysteine desulfurase-like protein [Bacteroidetes bacterium]|nr:MAG: cysteine desulfurase-like protein [Bacteroidota bacterium]
MSLDLDFVRAHFPGLKSPWAFFDNAGGSHVLAGVAHRIQEFLLSSPVQHGASYAMSQLGMQRVAEATAAVAALIGAAHREEVVMGPSTTAQLRWLSISLGRTLVPGDEIIVSRTDHDANVSPWLDLQRQGIVIRYWSCNPDTYRLELADLEALLGSRTRLVAVTHCSNILGMINPIREIARRVHAAGALICVDGVAFAPHRRVDVQALGIDFYVFSTYKVYGPHYAVLYGKRAHLRRLPGVNHRFIAEDDLPYKFQPGNVNFELAYGMLGLTEYLQALAEHHQRPADSLAAAAEEAFALFAAHETQIAERLLGYLRQKAGIRIIGEPVADPARRVPTIAFVAQGRNSREIVEAIDPHQIAVRYGDFYAKFLIEDLGLQAQEGVVRVSMVHYNTLDEVDRLLAVLDQVL